MSSEPESSQQDNGCQRFWSTARALETIEMAFGESDYEWVRLNGGRPVERQLRTVRTEAVSEQVHRIRQEAWSAFDRWRGQAARQRDFSGVGDPVVTMTKIWLALAVIQAMAHWRIRWSLPAPNPAGVIARCRTVASALDRCCNDLI